MACAVTYIKREIGQNLERMFVSIAFTGSYTTGGDTIDLTGLIVPLGRMKIRSSQIPITIDMTSVNGYNYGFVKGTTQANGKIKITTASATELTQAAYPAGVTGDTIIGEIVLLKA